MFKVYKSQEIDPKPESNIKMNSPKKVNTFLQINDSPKKTEEKHIISTNSFSYVTNNSVESGKNQINSIKGEKAAVEPLTKNKLLSKKTKFNVNLIEGKDENNIISNEENATKIKKNKKIIKNSLTIKKNTKEGRWDETEHFKFVEALNKYGNDWKEVQEHVGSRSSSQVRSHAQKFFLKLKTFKDESLGLDLTSNDIKNFSDIINKIKEYEQEKKCNNILFIINRKLFDGNLKYYNNIIFQNNYKNILLEINKTIKERDDNVNSNNKEKEYNIKKEKKKKLFKNITFNKKFLKKKNDKMKDEKNNKKIENQNIFYNEEESYFKNKNNKYNFIGDYVCENNNLFEYETNEKCFCQFSQYINEINTISLINREYFC